MVDAAPERGERARDALRQIGRTRLAGAMLLVLAAVVVASLSWRLPGVERLERALYDWRFVAAAPSALEQHRAIVLVVYDEDTVLRTGKRVPLDRGLLAKALPLIDSMRPRAVGIDLLLNQPQPEDSLLAAALRSMRAPTYLGFTTSKVDSRLLDAGQEAWLRRLFANAASPQLHAVDIALTADVDRAVRRWPSPNAGLPQPLVPAIAHAGKGHGPAIRFRRPRNELDPPFVEIPIQFVVDYPAMSRPFVEGRYVLIGGLLSPDNDVPTPLSRTLDRPSRAVEVQAHMLAQRLDGVNMTPLPRWLSWVWTLVVTVLGAATGTLERKGWRILTAVGLELACILALPPLLERSGIDSFGVPALGWVFGWAVALLAVGAAVRAIGSEQRSFAQAALGRYLPGDVARQIIRDPARLTLEGEQREIIALFSDLEGFTALSHRLTPRELSGILNAYLDCMSELVLSHGGTLDKFVGDAVVAFWGAPFGRADDGARAVSAAVAMQQAGERFRSSSDRSLAMLGRTRVGLHRGEAVVGNFGGEGRIQYTALGDVMNTAARLESANKILKTGLLVSDAAAEAACMQCMRPMGRVTVSGRATPLVVWEPVLTTCADELVELRDAWRRYDSGDEAALRTFAAAAERHPQDAALEFLVYRLRAAGSGGSFALASK